MYLDDVRTSYLDLDLDLDLASCIWQERSEHKATGDPFIQNVVFPPPLSRS